MMLFHSFGREVDPRELPSVFNNPFYYSPHLLCAEAASIVRLSLLADPLVAADAARGKMLGVLVVRSVSGEVGFLAAFSGLLAGSNRVDGFVPPVYDLQAPDGYFRQEEARISALNAEITAIESGAEYCEACDALVREQACAAEALAALRGEYAANKAARAQKRSLGNVAPDEAAAMIKASQFEKAELARRKRAWQERIALKETEKARIAQGLDALRGERRERSAALQRWLFTQFTVLNACGDKKSLLEIFDEYTRALPPAGAGECAAPKLLHYAYSNGYTPLSVAEFWVGASPQGEVRRDGCYYGACKSKCEPILTYMLQGLNVEANALERGGEVTSVEELYNDEHILIVNKPAGVLSVPGVAGGRSLQEWLRDDYLHSDNLFVVHRLDMATSGVLVVAKSMEIFKALQALFARREVQKEYVALLDGVPSRDSGIITLPLAPDYANRPRQMVDYERGKEAVTHFELLRVCDDGGKRRALVLFRPVTGRTHQLRVHAAHPSGLDCPILGDALYGTPVTRLMLHARSLQFVHPVSGKVVKVECEPEFLHF